MPTFLRARTRRQIGVGLAGIAILALGLLLFAWSGVYNIAASRGHWFIIERLLQFGMRNSVELRARNIEAPPLDNPDLYRLGAGHFLYGCAWCHGGPEMPGNIVARSALPPPPDLSHLSNEWKDRDLFWIVKHGIKYTGMPGWVSQTRDDEVWAVVAFLKKLPQLDAKSYRDLVRGGADPLKQTGHEIALKGVLSDAVGACARCHGANERLPASNLVPVLNGQPAEFLVSALRAYANGARESGIMQPVAADLTPEAMTELATYYSGLTAPQTQVTASADAVARGRAVSNGGDPSTKIPACSACHNANALTSYPRLAGQNAAYMANRLRLWKGGFASHTDTEAIMAPIARFLSEQHIDDVSAYFSSLPGSGSAP